MTLPVALGAVAGGPQNYQIQRSLRFRSSASAYLSRTPASAGNQQKMTYSGWVKLGALWNGSQQPGDTLLCADAGVGVAPVSWINWQNGTVSLGYYPGGATVYSFSATGVYRDFSAWYHLVVSVDTTLATQNDRVKFYINGVQATTVPGNAIAQNTSLTFNTTNQHRIGSNRYNGSDFLEAYLAEVNFIDGQALTPSSFGQTDPVTGVWQPKKYTGTYGTNGFYLPFSDNTSATTLAYDKSGNNNNWTANNISTTAGATYDSMTDVPTLTSATAANFCTINPLLDTQTYATYSEGNLKISTTAATGYAQRQLAKGTMSIPITGKWYFTISGADCGIMIGDDTGIRTQYSSAYQSTHVRYGSDGSVVLNGGLFATVATYTASDEVGLAIDMNAFTVGIYKNGTLLTTVTGLTSGFTYYPLVSPNSGATAYTAYLNFGQRPFSYTPPTGFKALNTFNLPDPTIKKPNQWMDATAYTGNGGTQSITNAGMFQPDLVWVKTRVAASSNALFDSVRGATKALVSNSTVAENNLSTFGVTAFNSNGFTVVDDAAGDYYSNGGSGGTYSGTPPNYVGWQWKKGATPGFDIVTWTCPTNNTAYTVNHSLGVAPKMMILKARNNATPNWFVYHESMGNTGYMALNLTNGNLGPYTPAWNNTSPTATSFTAGTYWAQAAWNMVAYLFAEIPGFSKFGSYTGNGSTDGPFVYCGFRPKYILWKRADAVADWTVFDTSRDTYNVAGPYLNPNTSAAELTDSTVQMDLLSNGFKVRGTWQGVNASGGTFIFAAFAENPLKYSLAR